MKDKTDPKEKTGITVTVLNHETGESEERTLKNDWLVICDGLYYLDHIQKYANGTAVLTIKKGTAAIVLRGKETA